MRLLCGSNMNKLKTKIKGIKYIGPVWDNSGYARANRENILALHSLGIPVTISPISFESIRPDLGKHGQILNSLTNISIDYDVVLIHTTPEFWSKHREEGKYNIGYTIWETTKLHPDWPKYINSTVDKVLVGCEWNKEVFKDSGVTIPIGVVPHGIGKDNFDNVVSYNIENLNKDTYTFYSIFQWCYDDKTRVLTKGGFKYFKDVSYNDYIATLNKDTDELEYHKPENIVSFKRKDKMYKLKGAQFDLCVTPDHKMVVKEHKKNSYKVDPLKSWDLKPLNELVTVDKYGKKRVAYKYRTKKNCVWSGKEESFFYVPLLSDTKYPIRHDKPIKINMDDFLCFFGWYISEGSINITDRYYRVCITQSKSEANRQEIVNCIKSMGYTPLLHGKNIYFNSREIALYLKQFGNCYEKSIPLFIKELSSDKLMILLKSLFKGDGSFHKNGSWCKYVTTSKQLAEDVQECLLKVGFSGAVSVSDPNINTPGKIDGREIKGKRLQYTVSVNRECNEPSMYYANLEEIDYDGYVYCLTVPNHTMLVERNGKVLFCGNTERKHPIALMKSYWYAFQNKEDVALVLKTYRSDYSEAEKDAIRNTIKRLKAVTPMENYPPIFLLPNMLSEDEINGLHTRGDCYVSLDRGEGFGLSPFHAGARGNPIVITGFGGALEYAKEDNSYLIKYSLTPLSGMPWSPWYRGDQLWAEPDVYDGAMKMRHVFNNQAEAKQKGTKLKEYIMDNFNWEVIGKKIINEIEEIL